MVSPMKKVWKMTADTVSQTLFVTHADGTTEQVPLYGHEAFQYISYLWMKSGWATKFPYNFSWLGRPIIQIPEDMLMSQEVIYRVQPDVLIETGVAHGGSGIFYASLFEAMGKGRVISIDIEIRPHNRTAIEAHRMKKRITLIERSSTDAQTLTEVRDLIKPGESVMVVLDSNHTRAHVLRQLGGDALGIIYAAATVSAVLSGVLELGVSATIVREVAAKVDSDLGYVRRLIRTASLFYWSAYLLVALVIFFGAPFFIHRWLRLESMNPQTAITALQILAISAMVILPRALYTSVLRGLQRMV